MSLNITISEAALRRAQAATMIVDTSAIVLPGEPDAPRYLDALNQAGESPGE
jgi:hypothetical protein